LASSHLSIRISAAHTGETNTKFDTGNFYENLLRKTTFGYNQAKIMGTLHEHLCTFYCCQQHMFAIKALLCNTQCYIAGSGTWLSNTQRINCVSTAAMIAYMHHNNMLYVQGLSCLHSNWSPSTCSKMTSSIKLVHTGYRTSTLFP